MATCCTTAATDIAVTAVVTAVVVFAAVIVIAVAASYLASVAATMKQFILDSRCILKLLFLSVLPPLSLRFHFASGSRR